MSIIYCFVLPALFGYGACLVAFVVGYCSCLPTAIMPFSSFDRSKQVDCWACYLICCYALEPWFSLAWIIFLFLQPEFEQHSWYFMLSTALLPMLLVFISAQITRLWPKHLQYIGSLLRQKTVLRLSMAALALLVGSFAIYENGTYEFLSVFTFIPIIIGSILLKTTMTNLQTELDHLKKERREATSLAIAASAKQS